MEWISVKDRLPEDTERVLITDNVEAEIAYFFKDMGFKMLDGGDWFSINSVTHWMPLPSPPAVNHD